MFRSGAGGSSPASSGVILACVLAAGLVMLRSAIYIIYPQSFFDSDQGVLGLMAKHASEGRAFPLFFYGQSYMLGVDAWLAAVVFLVTGPTVSALHAALMFEGIAAVVLSVLALIRADGLRPMLALVALLPIAFAPPLTATYFLDAASTGAPFLYVAALWWLRRRPIAFGIVAAIGFLHREFAVYGVLALAGLEGLDGTLWERTRLREWAVACVAAVAVWQSVQAVKPLADFLGPGTRGQFLHGGSGSQIGNLTERMHMDAGELPARVEAMFVEHVPRVLGAVFVDAPEARQGRTWLRWPCLVALVCGMLRIAWLRMRGADRRPLSLSAAAYFLAVGVLAAIGYIATRSADSAIDRYLLLVLFIPVGVMAWLLGTDTSAKVRAAAVACVVVLAVGAALDHLALARRYVTGQEPDDLRQLSDALARRGITVAMSGYWRAYKISFVSRERTKVASSDFVRIDEYQALANGQGDRLITIRDTPCDGEQIIAGWWLCGHP